MWTQVRSFVENRISIFSQTLILLVFLVWVLSQFINPIQDFLVQNAVYNVTTLILLFEIGRGVVEIKHESKATGNSRVYSNQDAAWTEIRSQVVASRPTTVDMIEYSGQTVISIIEDVLRAAPQATIRLLVCHPDHALSQFETQRIEQTLEYFRQHMSGARLHIRCYASPASMRGRNFANQVVSVGWYSYHRREGRSDEGIQGHLNAMVVANASTVEGRDLLETFNRTFEDLWGHPHTVEWSSLASSNR
jgi:hypothetical protein